MSTLQLVKDPLCLANASNYQKPERDDINGYDNHYTQGALSTSFCRELLSTQSLDFDLKC